MRKLKLFRPRAQCHNESQIQWMTSTIPWPGLDADQNQTIDEKLSTSEKAIYLYKNLSWLRSPKLERVFCGKLQDYAKSSRTWRTSGPLIIIRYRNAFADRNSNSVTNPSGSIGSSFFAFKFNVMGPCSNFLFTDDSKTIEFSSSDLTRFGSLECAFSIHLNYGYRVHLSIQLLLQKPAVENGNLSPLRNNNNLTTAVINDDDLRTDDKNTQMIQNGRCDVVVQIEDVTGPSIKCLNDANPSASFSSLNNILQFHSSILRRNIQGKPRFT